jgi:hypothetical protein
VRHYRRHEQAPHVHLIGIAGHRRLVKLQVEAMLTFVVDEHLDGSTRLIERADDLAIVEVPRVQL